MKTKLLLCTIALTVSALFSTQLSAQCQASYTFTINSNTVTLTNTSATSGNPNYYWNFGYGGYNVISQNPMTVEFTSNGTFGICLTLYDSLNAGCYSTFCDSVFISGLPNPPCNVNFVYTSDSANQNGMQFFCQTGNYPISWSWDFGDGGTSTLQNPVHYYATAGTYTVCETMVNSYHDTCSICKAVTYYPCTLAGGFTVNSTSDPSVTFTNTTTGGVKPYYYWTFGDGSSAWKFDQLPLLHVYQYGGTYNVCLEVYDSTTYCHNIFCDTVKIVNAPALPCTAYFGHSVDSALNNGTFNFWGWSNVGTALAYFWDFGDGTTSSLQNPSHQYTQFGKLNVCLTVTTTNNGVCTSCDSIEIFGPTTCSASLSMAQDSINPLVWYAYPAVSGTAPFYYHWDFGDGGTSNQPNPSHTYAAPGHYQICLTIFDANGCSSWFCDSTYRLSSAASGSNMQFLVVVNPATGIEENFLSGISVFPNPASESIEISFGENVKGELAITDMTGRKVYSRTINSAGVKTDVSSLPAGCYDLSITSEKRAVHSKIMIAR